MKNEIKLNKKRVLDACCGSRMFWFNKENPDVVYCDNREMDKTVIWKSTKNDSVRCCTIKPDVVCDFRDLPFPDNTFYHVVFDPPHLLRVGDSAWLGKKYGKLPEDWKPYIKQGFDECMRVLKPNGTLIFKWAEVDIPLSEILKAIEVQPLYGHRSGKHMTTHWMAFIKG